MATIKLALILVGCTRSGRHTPHPAPTPPLPLQGATIVLDPGHGGADPGAVAGSLAEASVTYRLAATLRAELLRRGARVATTVHSAHLELDLAPGAAGPTVQRPVDAILAATGARPGLRRGESPRELYARAGAAAFTWKRQPRRIAFVSLHCDKLDRRKWFGARVYYDRRGALPSLASAVKRRLTERGFTYTRGGRPIPREYGVLNPSVNPIDQRILIEAATLSNAADRRRVLDPAWRWKLARTIADAIEETLSPPPAR